MLYRGTTYLKLAIGLGIMAALACEILWLMRSAITGPINWPMLLVFIFVIGILGASTGVRLISAIRRNEGSTEVNPWVAWLFFGALAAASVLGRILQRH